MTEEITYNIIRSNGTFEAISLLKYSLLRVVAFYFIIYIKYTYFAGGFAKLKIILWSFIFFFLYDKSCIYEVFINICAHHKIIIYATTRFFGKFLNSLISHILCREGYTLNLTRVWLTRDEEKK